MPTVIEKSIEQAIVKAAKSNKPMMIGDVAAHIGIDDETVVEYLRFMNASGELALDNPDALSLGTRGIEVRRIVAHGACVTQFSLDDEDSEPTQRPREDLGREDIEASGDVYRVTVLPEKAGTDGTTGRYVLEVCRNPGADGEFLVTGMLFEPDETGSVLTARDRAWEWWDDYKAELLDSPMPNIHLWLPTASCFPGVSDHLGKNLVPVDPETLGALHALIPAVNDGTWTFGKDGIVHSCEAFGDRVFYDPFQEGYAPSTFVNRWPALDTHVLAWVAAQTNIDNDAMSKSLYFDPDTWDAICICARFADQVEWRPETQPLYEGQIFEPYFVYTDADGAEYGIWQESVDHQGLRWPALDIKTETSEATPETEEEAS